MAPPSPSAPNWSLPNRLAYVVSHSYPYSSNGYAVRTHEVARALGKLGHEVIVFNRPGRPWTIEGFRQDTPVRAEQVIDGVRYVFLPLTVPTGANLRTRLRRSETILHDAFSVFRPAVVMAASNWENAEPAQNAARRLDVPFFYEQRGFWEMSRDAEEPGYADSPDYDRIRRNELNVAQKAKAVFTLNEAMKRELVARGVHEANIRLMPNGVPQPGPIERGLTRASLGITARHLLGYIGSLSAYEGVEDLIALLAHLRGDGLDAEALIVGSSTPKGLIGDAPERPREAALKALARKVGVADRVFFVPQVPSERVGAYYSMLDAFVMPRRRTPVTELVAPLKPYAAATYSVPTFLPNMPPMDEIAAELPVTLYPEGNIPALAGAVRMALTQGHPALTEPLPPAVQWARRVRPLSLLLRAEAEAAQRRVAKVMGPAEAAAAKAGAGPADAPPQPARFNTESLPEAIFHTAGGHHHVASIGPAEAREGRRITALTRENLLGVLATEEVGTFVINWPERGPEWAELWSIDNMRLNRQIMDACRIAVERGWQMQVLGPVSRSRAPLFRTVAGLLDEIVPEPAKSAGAAR